MNIRETATIRSPNGIDEECAKFTVDDVGIPFILKSTTDINEKYVFSAWVMSDEDSAITIEGKEIPATTEWKRQKVGYTASGSALKIYFNKIGTYYFYKSQLEIGDVATDWSPSPEDIEESLKATNAKFELVVNKDTLKSEINALADTFTFTGNGFVVNAENLSIKEDGTIIANNGEFKGTIESIKGLIGGFSINDRSLYNLDKNGYGTIVGIDGIETIDDYGSVLHKSYYSRYKYSNSELSTLISGDGTNFYSESNGVVTVYSGAKFFKNTTETGSINCDGFINAYGNQFIEWNGKMTPSSLISDTYVVAGTEMYLPNNNELRGMKNGYHIADYNNNNSNVIAYVSTGDRVVLGNANNSAPTEVRSPSALYLKCNETTGDSNNRYGISFEKFDYGASDSPFNTGSFSPVVDNYIILGRSNRRFRNVYSTNGVSTTSDRNRKHDIKTLDDKYIQLFDRLQPVTYILNESGERTHVGFISQDVENAMEEIGMSSMDFAGFCKDRLLDDEGNPLLDNEGNEQYYYSLRYSEFIAINTQKIKKIESQMNEKHLETEEWKKNIMVQLKELQDSMKMLESLLEK